MSSKLFIGGLAWSTNDERLREKFEEFGEVTEATVVKDRDTGRSRGFAFVNYREVRSAEEAKKAMDGIDFDGRTIRVDFASDRNSGGGGGRGNQSGDGYRGGGGGTYHSGNERGGYQGNGRGGYQGNGRGNYNTGGGGGGTNYGVHEGEGDNSRW